MATSRRQALMLFAVAAIMSAGVSGLLRRRGRSLDMRPHGSLPGFQVLTAGAVTGGLPDPFFGLDDGSPPPPVGDLADLFAVPAAPGQAQVASFSDYYCPYCRVLTKILAEEAEAGRAAVTWHELPLLGPSSVAASRAALSAGLQGAYLPFHRQMMRSPFRPSEAYLVSAAETLGIDPGQLIAGMQSAPVEDALQRAAGLANLFGIIGTPALVVGHVLVLGQISQGDLRRLIAQEAVSA